MFTCHGTDAGRKRGTKSKGKRKQINGEIILLGRGKGLDFKVQIERSELCQSATATMIRKQGERTWSRRCVGNKERTEEIPADEGGV